MSWCLFDLHISMTHLTCTDAKQAPQAALDSDVAGMGNATSASATDQITRQHRMTLDEAHLILNVDKREVDLETIMKVCSC